MKRSVALLVVVATFACAGCSNAPKKSARAATVPSIANSTANGRSIFQTGRDANGTQIAAARKPLFSSCAACHGVSGAGGRHFSDGAVSADLRRRALVTEQKTPYTLALLERAISTGVDNEGKPLDPIMPRWKLSKRDLHDVALYVATQLK